MEKKFIIDHLLRPHWKALAVAFVAVIIDGMADLFGPWPIKIVLDYVFGSHPLPAWAAGAVIATFGEGKWAILHFAAIATLAITALGAAASYTESYLTTRVGQWIMHDLRQELYHHIQGLSLSYYDRHKTGDLIGRMTNDVDAIQSFVSSSLLDMVVDVLTLGGIRRETRAQGGAYRRLAGRLPALSRQVVQTDARPVQDDRLGFESAHLHSEVTAPATQFRPARDGSFPRHHLAKHRLRQTRSFCRLDPMKRLAGANGYEGSNACACTALDG